MDEANPPKYAYNGSLTIKALTIKGMEMKFWLIYDGLGTDKTVKSNLMTISNWRGERTSFQGHWFDKNLPHVIPITFY